MKTYEEIVKYHRQAVGTLENLNCDGTLNESKLVQESIIYHKLVAEACEKQVAKKVKNIRFSRDYELAEHNIMEGECPDCGETMTGNTWGCYCGSCGVALDWGYDE